MNETPTKTEAETLREAGDDCARGWSHYTPTTQDAAGNITGVCAEAALARVQNGNPGAWARIRKVITPLSTVANRLNGIGVLGLVNCQPEMTQEIIVGAFRQAEADARAAGA